MGPFEALTILALVSYAVYRQSRVSHVTREGRFKLAIAYAVIGVAVGNLALPSGVVGVGLLVGGLVLSLVFGLWRGRLTRLWIEPNGHVYKKGTPLTIGLFVLLVAIKFGVGAWTSINHINDGGDFGTTMLMIAAMVAVQAELVWQRAERLMTAAPRVEWAEADERLATAS